MIDRTTWNGIVTLPDDDVAVRTSNYHGTALKQLEALSEAWIDCCIGRHDFMKTVMLDAGDDLQAATFTALTGFYRLSITATRSALELVTIGSWAQVCKKMQKFNDWRTGKITLSLASACDGLISGAADLQKYLASMVGDTLFDQKSAGTEGGFVRRLYSGISEFSHSRPGFTDADMRESNGPIYVGSAFDHVAWIQYETLGLAFVLLLLARPKMRMPAPVLDLYADVNRLKSRVTRAAFEYLHP